MNNRICILIIGILILYIYFRKTPIIEGNKKKKKKKKKKKQENDIKNVLAGTKSSCEIEDSPVYTHINHIKKPSKMHMGKTSGRFNKNMQGLDAYTDVLINGKSKATLKNKYLGGQFFTPTDVTCYGYDVSGNCTQQKAMCYNNQVQKTGLIGMFLDDISSLTDTISGSDTSCKSDKKFPACTEVVLSYTTDSCMGNAKAFLLNSDINKLNKGDFYKSKPGYYVEPNTLETWPNLPEEYTDENCTPLNSGTSESFTTISPDFLDNSILDSTEKYKDFFTSSNDKDPLKQMFILIVGLGGLSLLHTLMYKKNVKLL